jgi:hypothetical protein
VERVRLLGSIADEWRRLKLPIDQTRCHSNRSRVLVSVVSIDLSQGLILLKLSIGVFDYDS